MHTSSLPTHTLFSRLAMLCFFMLLLAGCAAPAAAPPQASAEIPLIATSTAAAPAPSATPPPTSAPSPTPPPADSPTPSPTWTPTATPRPEHAPALAPVDTSFFTNGSREQPLVALTFDLCQKPEYPAGFDQGIFDALVQAEAPATFFVGGDWARTHVSETLLLANTPLFELGNHSWSHPDLVELDRDQIVQEVLQTQEMLYQITGRQPGLFRLPGGTYNGPVLNAIAAQGLYTIQWDVVTADPVPDNMPDNINRIVQEGVQNGSIIIMHANGRGWHTAEALPQMIAYLRSQGYLLVTVSQLLGLQPLP